MTQWIALLTALAALLVVDQWVMRGRDDAMWLRTSAIASVAWVLVALAFFAVLLLAGERDAAGAFLAGYLVERALSLDNVFVFLLVFIAFGVGPADRSRLLTYGIVGALALRAVFILGGTAALEQWSWLSFGFAALLVWTGWRMFRHRHDQGEEQVLVDRLRRWLPVSATAGALAAIAIVDLLFAIDSIPAVLAITEDPYVVFAANAFALLGLRPLFFLVAELVDRLYYLKTALAALLVAVGLKMAAGEVWGKLGPEITLPVIAAILGAGVVASLLRERRLGAAASRS